MGLIYCLFTDRWVRLFQPLAFIDPTKGMGASGNLATEGSNVAIPEGQHKRFVTASVQRPLKCLRPQLSTRTTSKRDMLLMLRKFQSPMFRLETQISILKKKQPLTNFRNLIRYMNSARETSFQQVWDPEIVLLALMNIEEEEEDREDDILMDLEPPRQFRPRPLSNRFGIYCTRDITMHQKNERASHLDTKK